MPVTQEEIESIRAHFETAAKGGRCPQCGFDWTMSMAESQRSVTETPRACADIIAGRWDEARTKPDVKTWSPSGYLWHMADAIGTWAERLKALADDPDAAIVGFDQDDLAEVRGYDKMSPIAGLWALEHRVRDFDEALQLHPDKRWSFDHPDFGPWTVEQVTLWMAHDLVHHQHDIARAMNDR